MREVYGKPAAARELGERRVRTHQSSRGGCADEGSRTSLVSATRFHSHESRSNLLAMSDSPTPRPAVVLLSGGLDSATVLAIAKHGGFTPYAMSFRYGQRHEHELSAAARVAAAQGVARHIVVEIDLRQF